MNFKPIQKLSVCRTLSTGEQVNVGTLAQNRQGVFFQYNESYLNRFGNLSPYGLGETLELQPAPAAPHNGLHGVFADSLPDGWGLLLQDRIFRQNGILPGTLTQMDRLAFVGSKAMGALSFSPESPYAAEPQSNIDLAALGVQAQEVFDGQTQEVLATLAAAGSSGGARPKAQLFIAGGNWQQCRATPNPGDQAWLVKFTSTNLPLGHEEGICEAIYLHMAEQLGLNPAQFKLIDAPARSGACAWLALERFDHIEHAHTTGKLHMHSACGLLDADFRMPVLDYEMLIKVTRHLCKSPTQAQLQFRRAIFNLFACNQDDHSKNWAFLQHDNGQWAPAPFYDVTFSPHPYREHATFFMGHGKTPPLQTMQKLAEHAAFSNWAEARQVIEQTIEVLSTFSQVARNFGLSAETTRLIAQELESTCQANQVLLGVHAAKK